MVDFQKLHEVNEGEAFFDTFSKISPDMCELLKIYGDLNDAGKSEAIKRMQELMMLPQYKK